MLNRNMVKENSMSRKQEIMDTIAELQRIVEREIEWKLTDELTTKEVHSILNPVTFGLDQVAKRVEEMDNA